MTIQALEWRSFKQVVHLSNISCWILYNYILELKVTLLYIEAHYLNIISLFEHHIVTCQWQGVGILSGNPDLLTILIHITKSQMKNCLLNTKLPASQKSYHKNLWNKCISLWSWTFRGNIIFDADTPKTLKLLLVSLYWGSWRQVQGR